MSVRHGQTHIFSFPIFTTTTLVVVVALWSAFFGWAGPVQATDYSNSGFILRDPVITVEAGRSTNSSFTVFSSVGQTDIGKNTTAGFIHCAGFLYFPGASLPVVTATAGDGQVSLSWTASSGSDCTSISGYSVGRSTTAGGPYTYTSVGAVLSTTVSSLTNGTTYYFVVRTLDSASDPIEVSAEVSAAPQSAGGGGGGGGGGNYYPPPSPNNAAIVFSGMAYPNSPVLLLKDGQLAATTVANGGADFQLTLTHLSAGNYLFMLYAFDADGRKSKNISFQVSAAQNSRTDVSGLFIPPTLATDNFQIKQGETLNFFGYAAPNAHIDIFILKNTQGQSLPAESNAQGKYTRSYVTTNQALGEYQAQSKATLGSLFSIFNDPIIFWIGTTTQPLPPVTPPPPLPPQPPGQCPMIADLNNDCRVDIVDFSILIYWFDKNNFPAKIDINADGRVDIVDFSVMAFYWTG